MYFGKRFNRTIRDLLKKPFFEKVRATWANVLATITKLYESSIHSSTKLTIIQDPSNLNKRDGYQNLLDKRKRVKAKYKIHDLVRAVDSRETIS